MILNIIYQYNIYIYLVILSCHTVLFSKIRETSQDISHQKSQLTIISLHLDHETKFTDHQKSAAFVRQNVQPPSPK